MKRSIGSLFVGLACLVFALTVSATNYSGKGTWISSEGNSGEYSVGASITADEASNLKITETLKIGEETLNISLVIQKSNEHFYEVLNGENNEVIGNGYCLPLGDSGDKVCHSESVIEDFYAESTIKLTSAGIYRMGSTTMFSTGEKIIWMDELQPQAEEVLP